MAEYYINCLKVTDLVLIGYKGYNISTWASKLYILEGDWEEDIILLLS